MKKNDKMFLVIAAVIILMIVIVSIVRHSAIRSKGIYTVATIEKITFNKSGAHVHFTYSYKGQSYKSNFNPAYSFTKYVGRKFYIQILPGNPSQYDYFDIDVPDCAIKNSLEYEWRILPNCQ